MFLFGEILNMPFSWLLNLSANKLLARAIDGTKKECGSEGTILSARGQGQGRSVSTCNNVLYTLLLSASWLEKLALRAN